MSSRNSKTKRLNRRARERKEVKQPTFRVGVTGSFVPASLRTSLKYTVAWSAQADGAVHNYYLSGNRAQDPGGSLTSSRPPGFEYLAALYERYRVIGSKVELSAVNSSDTKDASAPSLMAYVALFPSNSNTAWTAYTQAASQPFAKTGEATSQQPLKLTHSMSTAHILGQKDILGADRLQSAVNTGPADEWFWGVSIQTDVDHAAAADVFLTGTVTYDVMFFDRIGTLPPSLEKLISQIYAVRCEMIAQQLQAKKERAGLHWESERDSRKLEGEKKEGKPDGWTKLKSRSLK